jgi:hypothetical protein
MNPFKKTAILVILASSLITVQAKTGEETGWINAFKGQPKHYTLKRGNETVPVAPLTTLLVGDQIIIKAEQHRMELRLQGGTKPVVVTQSNSPFLITEEGKVPTALGEFWKSVKGFLSYWYDTTPVEGPPITTGLNKGDEKQSPSLPWLTHSTRLIAGERALLLQWRDGKAPFRVQVTHTPLWKDTIILWEGTAENTHWITTTALNFDTKRKYYRVTVIDANGKKVTRGFRAIASDKIAGYPQQDSLTWLLQQDRHKWGFEILQRLAQRQ